MHLFYCFYCFVEIGSHIFNTFFVIILPTTWWLSCTTLASPVSFSS